MTTRFVWPNEHFALPQLNPTNTHTHTNLQSHQHNHLKHEDEQTLRKSLGSKLHLDCSLLHVPKAYRSPSTPSKPISLWVLWVTCTHAYTSTIHIQIIHTHFHTKYIHTTYVVCISLVTAGFASAIAIRPYRCNDIVGLVLMEVPYKRFEPNWNCFWRMKLCVHNAVDDLGVMAA